MRRYLIKLVSAGLILLLSFSIASADVYASTKPILREGMSGSSVKTLQNNLKKLGFFSPAPTGYFGSSTVTAVKKFQKKYNLPATGVVATLTYNKLDALLKPAAPKKTATKSTPSGSIQKPDGLKKGSSGKEVSKLQNDLKLLGYMKVSATGDFGPITEGALTQFQKYYKLEPNGIASSATLSAIARLLSQAASSSRGDADRGERDQNGADTQIAHKPFYQVKLEWIPGLPQSPFLKGVGKYDGVVIHYTASPNDTARTEADHERKYWSRAFVHEFIDPNEIIQVANPDYKAWGAGERANDRFIHLELCDAANQSDFNISFEKITMRAAEYLYINRLGVTPAKADGTGTLWSHKDVTDYLGFTNHTDPIAYLAKWGRTWDDVIRSVMEKYNAIASGGDPEAKAAADVSTTSGITANQNVINENATSKNVIDGDAIDGDAIDGDATDRNATDENAANDNGVNEADAGRSLESTPGQ